MFREFKDINQAFESLVDQLKRGTIKSSSQLVERIDDESVNNDVDTNKLEEVQLLSQPCTMSITHPTKRIVFNEVLNLNPFENLLLGVSLCTGQEIELETRNLIGWSSQEFHSVIPMIVNELTTEVSMKEAAVTLRDSGSISLLVRRNSYSNTKELDAFLWTYGGDLFADFLGPKTFCLSVLQEFLAATLGVYVGKLFFVSPTPLYSLDEIQLEQFGQFSTMFDPSYEKVKETVPLVADPATFYAEATELLNNYKDTDWLLHVASELTESFIRDVMVPMMMAYQLWRTNKKRDAYDTIKLIKADDWRLVSKNWLANNERMNDAKEDTE